ncbi:MAG: hypothetical protein DWQ37_22745 [Planctomycetota bacterium]|nr:MAG: hypothetical protein DWQ37_22745 [Planctomycetota bacterium]
MHTEGSHFQPAGARSRPPRVLAWLGALIVLLACIGYFVLVPLGEMAVRGVGALVGTMAQAVATVAGETYASATFEVRNSPAVEALLGAPVVCAPLANSRWVDASARNALEFEFDVEGPRGVGTAYVVAVPTNDAIELKSVVVNGPDGAKLILP